MKHRASKISSPQHFIHGGADKRQLLILFGLSSDARNFFLTNIDETSCQPQVNTTLISVQKTNYKDQKLSLQILLMWQSYSTRPHFHSPLSVKLLLTLTFESVYQHCLSFLLKWYFQDNWALWYFYHLVYMRLLVFVVLEGGWSNGTNCIAPLSTPF